MQVAYSHVHQPPAPVLTLRVSNPVAQTAALVTGLVDTGADLSVLPCRLIRQLGLALVGEVPIEGFAGPVQSLPLFRARVQIATLEIDLEFLGQGTETLVGRDLLKHLTLELDGPNETLRVLN